MRFGRRIVPLDEQQLGTLAVANSAFGYLLGARRTKVRMVDLPGMASWALESYVQLCVHRSVALLEGMCAEWNSRRLLNCLVISRSFIETAAAMSCVLDDIPALLPKEDIRAIHGRAVKAMFGRRDLPPGDTSMPTATNVMTLLDRLDGTYNGIRHCYELLCEIVHPNCSAFTIFIQPTFDTGEVEIDLAHANRDSFVLSGVTLGLSFVEIAKKCHQKYIDFIKPQVEDLDRKFGWDIDKWPPSSVKIWSPSDPGAGGG
jgi:hypothetical protein